MNQRDGTGPESRSEGERSLFDHVHRIAELHEAEVAQRHHPIAWWRERFGEDWVQASTKARRELDAAIYEAKADWLDTYGNSLPDGVSTEAFAEARNLRRRAADLRG